MCGMALVFLLAQQFSGFRMKNRSILRPDLCQSSGRVSTPASRRVFLLTILGIALALRLAHWWAVRDEPFFALLAMDSQEYDRWAQEIAGGDWLGSQVFFQAPLYPYILAVIYKVAGWKLDAVYLLQITLAVAGIWALYRAARTMADERTGLVAAGLAA